MRTLYFGHSVLIILPKRFLTLKDHDVFPVASTATPYPWYIKIGGCDACECIFSLYAYISWRSDQMTWTLRNLRLRRLVFRLRDASKVRKSRSLVEFAYATPCVNQYKKKSMRARSRASTHACHIHARACFLIHRFFISELLPAIFLNNKSQNVFLCITCKYLFIIQIFNNLTHNCKLNF